MKVLVCGSRTWDCYDAVVTELSYLGPDVVIHGGAMGADRMATDAAHELGATVQVFKPDWDTYGRKAGIVRNVAMLDEKPDVVVAFWDGVSRGTQHTIEETWRRGIRTVVVSSATDDCLQSSPKSPGVR